MKVFKYKIHIPTFLFTTLSLIIIPIFLFIDFKYRHEIEKRNSYIKLQEEILDQYNFRFQDLNLKIIRDLEHISDSSLFKEYLKTGNDNSLISDWINLSRINKSYDQIRFLDKNGMEKIRINYEDGNPYSLDSSLLQDKSDRYYFKEALTLPHDTILISKLDLNIEDGMIEIPIKPMIRYNKSVYIDDNYVGSIVINFLAQNFIDILSEDMERHNSTLYLANPEGFLLYGPEVSSLWGFMFGNRNTIYQLPQFPPHISNDISSKNDKLFIKRKISLSYYNGYRVKQLDSYWELITKSEDTIYYNDILFKIMSSSWHVFFIYFILSLILSIFISHLIYKVVTLNKDKMMLTEIMNQVVNALEVTSLLDDDDTGNHIRRVSEYSYVLAKSYGLSEKISNEIKMFASLHDIGKVGVHDKILKKPGPLNTEERIEMNQHVVYGQNVIENTTLGRIAFNIVCYHHENWDGSGYAKGLIGSMIPVEARIVSLADVYDAIRNKRCYKPAMTHEEALYIIKNDNGKKFEPKLVRTFLNVEKLIEEISINLK